MAARATVGVKATLPHPAVVVLRSQHVVLKRSLPALVVGTAARRFSLRHSKLRLRDRSQFQFLSLYRLERNEAMATRQLLGKMVELAPPHILRQFIRGLSMQGIRPRFKVGNTWATFDANDEVLRDDKGVAVSTGSDFSINHLTEVDWGTRDIKDSEAKLMDDTVSDREHIPGFAKVD